MKSTVTSHPTQVIAREDTNESVCYEILDILGEGGSGVTYRARNSQTQELVALKALSLHRIDDWKSIELFEREAKILSKLNRDGIPKYLDYFTRDTDGDRYFYIVQALAPGKTLAEWMDSGWRATETDAKHIALEILNLLIYLHRHTPPIIHRDIKPSNILRTADGKISLVDFGAVQQTYHDTFMRGSTVVGTYGYMAPEQFRGQAVPVTDLYGLGATILHLLTHRSPAEIPQDGLRLNFCDRLQVSSSFADWLECMLEPDASQRFSSAIKASSMLKSPPKVFKPTLGKNEFILAGAIGLFVAVLMFGLFDRYKYYFLDAAGFVMNEPFAAMSNNPSVEKMRGYIDRGFNVNNKNQQGETLLTMAIDRDLPEIVKLLIEKGASLKNEGNEIQSLRVEKRDLIKKIDEKRIKIISWSNTKKSTQESEVKALEQELELKRKETGVNGVAYYAVKKNRVDILQAALDGGVRIDGTYPDENKLSLLHLASLYQDGQLVRLLIERGADPNIKDNLGCTPLHTAILRDRMPYKSNSYRYFDPSLDDNLPSRAAMMYLVRGGAKIDIQCNLIKIGKGKTWHSDKQLDIRSMTASKFKINYPESDTDAYTSPSNLLMIFNINDIDLKSHIPDRQKK